MERMVRTAAGFAVLPVLYVWILYRTGFRYNFSGLLAESKFRAFVIPVLILTVLFTAGCLRILQDYIFPISFRPLLKAFGLAAITAIVVPYKQGHPAVSSVHLAAAYTAFGLFVFILYLVMNKTYQRCLYSGLLFLMFLLCIQAGEISGPAELVFAAGTSMMLALLTLSK